MNSKIEFVRTIEEGTPGTASNLTDTLFIMLKSSKIAGTYRVAYYGDAKPLIGTIFSFTGVSSPFTVV
jgi:Neutral/alkaline non-lysosomal ceramidase, C-terminal